MANVTFDEDRKPPLVHNAYCFPELITFGPEMIREVPKLLWSISVVMVSFNYDRLHENSV